MYDNAAVALTFQLRGLPIHGRRSTGINAGKFEHAPTAFLESREGRYVLRGDKPIAAVQNQD